MTDEPWQRDWLLARPLLALSQQVHSVSSLAHPLYISDSSPSGPTIALDYAFFLFVRSFCRAVMDNTTIDGGVLSLFLFDIARRLIVLDQLDLAYPVLYRAVELRSRHAVHNSIAVVEALYYQKAVNIALVHERAHALFVSNQRLKDLWCSKARQLLNRFSDPSKISRTYPDADLRNELSASAMRFLGNDIAVEEVACDLFAVENALLVELGAARILALSIYVARMVAEATSLMVHWFQGRIFGDKGAASERLTTEFLSSVQIRSQIIIVYAMILRENLNLRRPSATLPVLEERMNNQDKAFDRTVASVRSELHQCQSNAAVIEAIQINKAIRHLGLKQERFDCKIIIDLFYRNFGIAHQSMHDIRL